MSTPSRRTPTRRRSVRLALIAAIVALAAGSAGAAPASAQAARVHVSVRTSPALPRPGDDVSARVGITGCAPGTAVIETYLTFDDGYRQTSIRLDQTTAQSSLLFTSTTVVTLRHAIEGWYGVRVVCGNFRPPREPMTNTLFVVGARPTGRALVTSPTAVIGATIGYHGTECTGDGVEYSIQQIQRNAAAFDTTGTIAVQPDGSWIASVTIPPSLEPGPARIRARCAHRLDSGDTAYVYYQGDQQITLSAPAAKR